VWPLLESGKIKPVIHSTFAAAEPSRQGAHADGIEPAHRQDRADMVTTTNNAMTTKKKLIAGNWKMNGSLAANEALVKACSRPGREPGCCDVALCAPAPYLAQLQIAAGGHAGAGTRGAGRFGASSGCVHRRAVGGMLKDFGVRYAIVGHSERRQYHGETDELAAEKAALAHGITPIVCVGETLAEREAGQTEEVVKRQLAAVIHVNGHCISEIVVAYEPVWAIGTGKTARRSRRRQVHAVLRAQLASRGERACRRHQHSLRRQHERGQCRQLLAQPTSTAASSAARRSRPPTFCRSFLPLRAERATAVIN
jgi:triosephosphate isomerase